MMMFAAAQASQPVNLIGWDLGLGLGSVVVSAVVALVVPILLLAWRIGKQASMINEALQRSYRNTSALADLRQTIKHATVIVEGLQRGRARLGG
jgi:hypothetical protein